MRLSEMKRYDLTRLETNPEQDLPISLLRSIMVLVNKTEAPEHLLSVLEKLKQGNQGVTERTSYGDFMSF